jgi:hypothetical protein
VRVGVIVCMTPCVILCMIVILVIRVSRFQVFALVRVIALVIEIARLRVDVNPTVFLSRLRPHIQSPGQRFVQVWHVGHTVVHVPLGLQEEEITHRRPELAHHDSNRARVAVEAATNFVPPLRVVLVGLKARGERWAGEKQSSQQSQSGPRSEQTHHRDLR